MVNNNDQLTNLLNTFLSIQSQRVQVVAGNLANADTPGFKAKELNFNEFLKEAAENVIKPTKNPLPAKTLSVVNQNTPFGVDGNNVDTAQEMSTLAEAGMQYMTGIELLQAHWRILRLAIREGK